MKEKILNKKNSDILLFVIVFFAVIYFHNSIVLNILLVSTIIYLLIKYISKEKYKLSLLLTTTIILSLFIGVHYKLFFLTICCIGIGYYLKKGKLLLLSFSLLISPSIYLSNLYTICESGINTMQRSLNIYKYNPIRYGVLDNDNNKWAKEYNNLNGRYHRENLNNISYYYNACQVYNIYCNPIENFPEQRSSISDLSVYFRDVSRYDKYGNIYRIVRNKGIDSKRYLYSFNKGRKNLKETTIFIPMNKEEVVIYNYFWLKDFVWEEVVQSNNKCKLLFYGTQNGWDKYRSQLINDLNNDKNNSCINNIEDYDIEIDKNKLEKDKKDFINVLKDKGEE